MEIIDDEYWINYAKKSIDDSITVNNNSSEKLQKLVFWFWTVYTTYFAIGTTINLIDAPPWTIFLMSSPIITLIITYGLCDWVQTPVSVTFDPRIPYEIRIAYTKTVTVKQKRFSIALGGAALSALLLALSLFMYNISGKTGSYNLDVTYNKEAASLFISGVFPGNTEILTQVDSLKSGGGRAQVYTDIIKSGDKGLLAKTIKTDTLKRKLLVSATWSDKGQLKGFFKIIEK
jgi:hypothetical protein